MIFRYELDSKNRVKGLLKDIEANQHLDYVEVEPGFQFKPFFHGVRDHKLYDIGFDAEYEAEQEKLDKKYRIKKLKKWLADSDWKVVVNAELIQAGLPPKYPNLYQERQAWRDEINALES